jgi:hypothetical protein
MSNEIYGFAGGLGTVLTLVLDILILREIILSDRDLIMKLLWIILVLTLPLLGVLIYLLFSGRHHRARASYSQIV